MKQHHKDAAERGDQTAGSPMPDEPVFLVIGKFRRPHGLRGEIFFEVMTDFPDRLIKGKEVFVGDDFTPMVIERVRPHQAGLLITLKNIVQREAAANFTNQLVYIKAGQAPPLKKGQFYHHEILGMAVEVESGDRIGLVEEILETGANDVLVVLDAAGQEVLLPVIDEVVLEIDIKRRRIIVKPPEWV